MKRRILLTMEYDGSAFCGWQLQENLSTVQGAVQQALSRATGEDVHICASGRTDSGVHALNQTAHFDTYCGIPAEKICLAVNTFLPETVRVKHSCEVAGDFHARYSAVRKTYLYKMYRAEISSPVRRLTHAMVPPDLSVPRMQDAAQVLLGEHDFSCFRAAGSSTKGSVRTMYAADFTEQGDEIVFSVTGSGFLYHMVRNIVGTLWQFGRGLRKPREMSDIITSGNRAVAGVTAPAAGLYLANVEY